MNKTNIVGTQFSKAVAEGITEGAEVTLSPEPENKFDDKAVAVHFNKERLGYIGKNSSIYDMDRDLFPLKATVNSFYRKEEGDKFKSHDVGNLVACTIEVPDLDPDADEIISFTEGVPVNFNEGTHTYTYQGRILSGGTSFIKKYIQPFDSVGTAEFCSKNWGIPAKEVLKAWSLSGDIARDYGNSIHKALEFEQTYRDHKKKGGERCFVIKHPIIRQIVDDFYTLYDTLKLDKGEVLSEVLVTDVDAGLSGLIDRLVITDNEKKTCRLQDFKVNHSFLTLGQETFVNLPEGLELPGNKLSKLSLQLKYYASLLEKKGWTVQGFDAFVYEGGWRYYPADTLDGFDILNNTYKEVT